MALFNYATKEITLKVVYYGPGLSGKTTNIEFLHSSFDQARRGKLLSLSTETDRTLFFDFLPIEIGKIRDFSIRFQVYTVPGQVRYNATRKLVLKGSDAIVFVADSQVLMRDANLESLENMRENLMANDLDPDDIPIMFQYNKRDLPNILSIEELNSDLNHHGAKYFPSVAIAGSGVTETFQEITRDLIKHIAKKHRIDISMREPNTEREAAAASAAGHAQSAPVLTEPVPAPPTPAESPEEEPVYALEESEEIPEVPEMPEGAPPSDYFGTVGDDEEDITIEVIDGLQSQEELMEESTHVEQYDLEPAEPDERLEHFARVEEEIPDNNEEPPDDEEEIEHIYKAFMSEEKEELPPVDESVSETLDREERQRKQEDDSLLKRFRESIKSPRRRDGGTQDSGPPEEYDIFAELEREAREEEQRLAREQPAPEAPEADTHPMEERAPEPEEYPAEPHAGAVAESRGIEPAPEVKAGTPPLETPSEFRGSETPTGEHTAARQERVFPLPGRHFDQAHPSAAASERTLSATENLMLDEINTISRTMRKIHDSMNSLKSETLILTRRLEEIEKHLAALNENGREVSEMLRSGGGRILSEELAQAIMSLKASIDTAKKKKLWMLFS